MGIIAGPQKKLMGILSQLTLSDDAPDFGRLLRTPLSK
jgi:hypothetical protein